ncbi:MAG TPA: DUF5777 family beta-barrel protein [Chitinophagaceae bacterium]|nr:DUF5777 family beta-barrel protein [Chitinophagaceae bacterium]
MKRYFWLIAFLLPLQLFAQDTTANDLLKDMDNSSDTKKASVEVFKTQRAINANTTEMVGKGKMDFRVTHYFDDIDGKGASMTQRFLGLDNARDIRVGFHIGLNDNLDVAVARVKGAGAVTQNASGSVLRFFEFSLKYRFMEQRENDPSHPLAMALFVSNAISSVKRSVAPNTNFENSFTNFSDRNSQAVQLIIAKKIGKVSVSLNPTYVHTNFVVQNDDKNMFALGGAIRVPLTRKFNLLVDYFHPFRSQSSKDFFNTADNSYNPPADLTVNSTPFKFYDPLGVGFEIVTAGHVFSLNFTNAVEILENRFIRFTTKSWTKGQYRWCFTISRKFVLWRSN